LRPFFGGDPSGETVSQTPPGETVKQEKIEIALPPNPKSAPRKQLRNNKSD